jgi:hypothetical protein
MGHSKQLISSLLAINAIKTNDVFHFVDSNHYGIAGWYGIQAANEGLMVIDLNSLSAFPTSYLLLFFAGTLVYIDFTTGSSYSIQSCKTRISLPLIGLERRNENLFSSGSFGYQSDCICCAGPQWRSLCFRYGYICRGSRKGRCFARSCHENTDHSNTIGIRSRCSEGKGNLFL